MKVGSLITTKHFGGLEAVTIAAVEEGFFVASRFKGRAFEAIPKDAVEEVLRDGPHEDELWQEIGRLQRVLLEARQYVVASAIEPRRSALLSEIDDLLPGGD